MTGPTRTTIPAAARSAGTEMTPKLSETAFIEFCLRTGEREKLWALKQYFQSLPGISAAVYEFGPDEDKWIFFDDDGDRFDMDVPPWARPGQDFMGAFFQPETINAVKTP